jgi:exodeoxyribonuclease V alpha subunit
MEHITGTIDRVTFHNPENGFVVLRAQVPGRRGPVTVVGQTPRAVAGEFFEADGVWQLDPEHGLQFKAENLRTTPPHTPEGIEKYLGSGLIKGIGPHYARKIVQVFGPRTLAVIDESPSFLKEVKGIGPQRLRRIRESWKQQKAVRGIMVFLQSHGVGTARAIRIYKTYGERALDRVREDPYRLATDVWGIGFQTADELARRLGLDPQSVQRARAALRFILEEAGREGHCAYPEAAARERAAGLTGIAPEVLAEAADALVTAGEAVRETARTPEPWLYLRPLHQAETGTAERLAALLDGPHPLAGVEADEAVRRVEAKMGLALAGRQREAIGRALTQKVLVLTGGPGTGKSTLVRGVLDVFEAGGLRCGLAAPTGRAARRLAEATGREARTLHRLLELGAGGPKRHPGRPLDLDLLVVDEASMMDVELAHHLLRALPPAACLVLVGDADQLPSVGPGAVLADVIASRAVPVVRLTEIFRQAEASGIVRAAHAVHAGELPESATAERPGEFYFIEADEPAVIRDRIVALVRDRIPARFGLDGCRDVQVLTPMNRFELGARALNATLQEVLNPPQDGPEVARFGWTFRPGDKVLQTANDYGREVFNGDIGRIVKVDAEDQELHVDFDGRPVRYDFDELDELALAYALTVHKSQGAEYPAVIIPLHPQQYRLLRRDLLYTGITRGKRLVVLVGSRKALGLAVGRGEVAARYTALAHRLREQIVDATRPI